MTKGGYLYASDLNQCNDETEKEWHKDLTGYHYVLCFCNSKFEKIPMWYLYGGISGEGVRLSLMPTKMAKVLASIETVYPIGEDLKPQTDQPLTVGKDIRMEGGWTMYRRHGDSYVRYRNKSYTVTDYTEEQWKENLFVKDYEWEYEKEFRIVFSSEKSYGRIAIPIDVSAWSITFAPEMSTETKEKVMARSGFINYSMTKCKDSKLHVKMDLRKRNFNQFLQYAEEIMKSDKMPDERKRMDEFLTRNGLKR